MQSIPSNEEIMADFAEAYRQIKEVVARLKNAFDKIEDEAILNGKAIPLMRLLQSALRTQIQLIGKIERLKKIMDGAPALGRHDANNGADGIQQHSTKPNPTPKPATPKQSSASVHLDPALSHIPLASKQLVSDLMRGKKSQRNDPIHWDEYPAPGLLMQSP